MHRFLPIIVFLCTLLSGNVLQAQKTKLNRFNGKNKKKPFPSTQDYKPAGWIFGLGTTGTFQLNDQSFTQTISGLEESYRFEPIMKPGVMLELGRYLNFERKFLIDFVDITALWKMYRGGQNITQTRAEGVESGENSFTEHYNSASLNVNNIIRVNDYNFVLNAFGLNTDYKFANSVQQSNLYPQGIPNEMPPQFVAQFHYKLGWGIKADVDKVLLFSLETPVYNITPQTTNFSEFDYFNMPFRTLIFRVQFMPFRYDNDKCPPVNNPNVPAGFKNGYGSP